MPVRSAASWANPAGGQVPTPPPWLIAFIDKTDGPTFKSLIMFDGEDPRSELSVLFRAKQFGHGCRCAPSSRWCFQEPEPTVSTRALLPPARAIADPYPAAEPRSDHFRKAGRPVFRRKWRPIFRDPRPRGARVARRSPPGLACRSNCSTAFPHHLSSGGRRPASVIVPARISRSKRVFFLSAMPDAALDLGRCRRFVLNPAWQELKVRWGCRNLFRVPRP